MTTPSTIFDFMCESHGKTYMRFLFDLYRLETEDGIDTGHWPTYDEFVKDFLEEEWPSS